MLKLNSSKTKNILSDFIFKTSYIFTLIVFVFSLIGVLFANSDAMTSALPCGMLLWTLLFSALMSLISIICDFLSKKISNTIILTSFHFVLSYFAFLIVFVFGGGASAYLNESAITNTAFKVIVMTLIFVGIYVIVSAIKIAYSAIKKKIIKDNSLYDKIYTDINSENN